MSSVPADTARADPTRLSDHAALSIAERPLKTLVPGARAHRCRPIRALSELANAVLNEV